MEKTFVERRVYKGGPVKKGYVVTKISCEKDEPDSLPAEIIKVSDIDDYSSGCPLHRGTCFGHMCVTPTGSLLPPHSLSFRSGDIRTQYYVAAALAFGKDDKRYINELKKTNYKKEGHLRSIMSTPVSGSARLVVIPHYESIPFETGDSMFHIYISENLASKIRFCLPSVNENGLADSVYTERTIREGDFVILERAPSLTVFSDQPFSVRFWEKECAGVHPGVFNSFSGDFDGDEVHIYAIGTPEAVEEANAWIHPVMKEFLEASSLMQSWFPRDYTPSLSPCDMEFISNTTLSFQEILEDEYYVPIGDLTRNKLAHVEMLRKKLSGESPSSTFLEDARKGVEDIKRQQLSQGIIGDMGRVAKIALMGFVRGPRGGTYVVTRNARIMLDKSSIPSKGSPVMRAIMLLHSISQQSALEAHRVGSTVSNTIDLISNFMKGRSSMKGTSNSCDTLVVLKGLKDAKARKLFGLSWVYEVDGHLVGICKDSSVTRANVSHIAGSYSPVVLSLVDKNSRWDVCNLAITVLYNYYGLSPESDDIRDLVTAFSYKVEMSVCPITTREGMLSRDLGWMETLMACDYTKLPSLEGSSSSPYTATSATMCSNFSML